MMQKFLLSILLLVLISIGFTQTYTDYEDIVILKDGSKIHGIIIEEKPYEYIKIQSGKNIFVFEFDEIELLKKELVNKIELEQKKLEQKTWSFTFGLGTNRNFSLLGISKDFRLGNPFSFFVTADIPVFIIIGEDQWGHGHALLGIGIIYQKNYNSKGFKITNTLSYQMYDGVGGDWINHSSINYQWKIGPQSFISSGIMIGRYWESDYYDSKHHYRLENYVWPTISYDFRF